ncbi:MAG: transcriptional regulator, partial [bacterium]|nr:transcriptional regulator [bacterium]
SFEQGWREIPVHIERQILYLLAKCLHITSQSTLCWDMMECPDETRLACPAWEFQCGHICWFINGTICKGVVQHSWREKTKLCRQCDMLKNLLAELEQDSDTETQL